LQIQLRKVNLHQCAEVTGICIQYTVHQQHRTEATGTDTKKYVNLHQWAEVTGTEQQQNRTKVTGTPHIRTAKRNRLSTSSDGNKDYRYIQ
jgi:hypothetical protein